MWRNDGVCLHDRYPQITYETKDFSSLFSLEDGILIQIPQTACAGNKKGDLPKLIVLGFIIRWCWRGVGGACVCLFVVWWWWRKSPINTPLIEGHNSAWGGPGTNSGGPSIQSHNLLCALGHLLLYLNVRLGRIWSTLRLLTLHQSLAFQ